MRSYLIPTSSLCENAPSTASRLRTARVQFVVIDAFDGAVRMLYYVYVQVHVANFVGEATRRAVQTFT